jgi:drug/metabolite transporter (DMT)-like permease
MAVWGAWVVYTILCLLVIWQREGFGNFIAHGREFKWIILLMGIFDTIAWTFYSFAVFDQEIAITTAISESYPAIALFLGLWFNKEVIKKHQYVGAALALLCSFLLALTIK